MLTYNALAAIISKVRFENTDNNNKKLVGSINSLAAKLKETEEKLKEAEAKLSRKRQLEDPSSDDEPAAKRIRID